jgi:hypothetical protein
MYLKPNSIYDSKNTLWEEINRSIAQDIKPGKGPSVHKS